MAKKKNSKKKTFLKKDFTKKQKKIIKKKISKEKEDELKELVEKFEKKKEIKEIVKTDKKKEKREKKTTQGTPLEIRRIIHEESSEGIREGQIDRNILEALKNLKLQKSPTGQIKYSPEEEKKLEYSGKGDYLEGKKYGSVTSYEGKKYETKEEAFETFKAQRPISEGTKHESYRFEEPVHEVRELFEHRKEEFKKDYKKLEER